ncbi:MAG: N-formylglutamate amidohydrolase [Pseudobdellovibrio sp.]
MTQSAHQGVLLGSSQGYSSDDFEFIVTMPHSGERVPEQCSWLLGLDEKILMCDVDRFIDRIYEPALKQLKIPFHKTEWHRYAVDLNRIPSDIDCDSVQNSSNSSGQYSRGYHWVVTTQNHRLMKSPMSVHMHEELTQLIYDPFHCGVRKLYSSGFAKFKNVYHLDAHSMPSRGTSQHRDPGELRADIVVSDSLGKSCSNEFRDLVIAAYVTAGFRVGYNWPYVGGRVTEQYGQPLQGQHAIQVELNRMLYMNEESKCILSQHTDVQIKVEKALGYIKSELPKLRRQE